MKCDCKCKNEKEDLICYIPDVNIFGKGRIKFFCLNFEPLEEEPTVEQLQEASECPPVGADQTSYMEETEKETRETVADSLMTEKERALYTLKALFNHSAIMIHRSYVIEKIDSCLIAARPESMLDSERLKTFIKFTEGK